MRSFRLLPPERSDWIEIVVGLGIPTLVCASLHAFAALDAAPYVLALIVVPFWTVFFFRGGLKRIVRDRYPSARHAWLLGFAAAAFVSWLIAQRFLPRIGQGLPTLGFLLPTMGAIVAFLVINRDAPDVMQ